MGGVRAARTGYPLWPAAARSESRIRSCGRDDASAGCCGEYFDLQRCQRNASKEATGKESGHPMLDFFQEPAQGL
jgi:hypothetical protein